MIYLAHVRISPWELHSKESCQHRSHGANKQGGASSVSMGAETRLMELTLGQHITHVKIQS